MIEEKVSFVSKFTLSHQKSHSKTRMFLLGFIRTEFFVEELV